MKKGMLEIKVTTANNYIIIQGPTITNVPARQALVAATESVVISRDQVDILIEWLKEAKDELNGSNSRHSFGNSLY